jgi:hypothetical protein
VAGADVSRLKNPARLSLRTEFLALRRSPKSSLLGLTQFDSVTFIGVSSSFEEKTTNRFGWQA